jgi:uncharacterized membrane protein YfcA
VLEVSCVLLVATAFRTAFGFGEALIAVPLLSLFLPVKVAAPVAVLASIVIALAAVVRDWRHIQVAAARRLLLATALGLPFGLLALRYVAEGPTKAVLGALLLAFALLSLARPGLFVLRSDRWIWLFGFLAGVTGGSYGMNGPPLAIYGAARAWPPERFRATMQAYFLPASCLGMGGYWTSGLWTREVNVLFVESLPAIALGILAGRLLSRTMDRGAFARCLYVGLVCVGGLLLAQAYGAF